MGLTVYYDWKTKTELPSARRLITKFRAIALKLPFDDVSEIHEQDPPDRFGVVLGHGNRSVQLARAKSSR